MQEPLPEPPSQLRYWAPRLAAVAVGALTMLSCGTMRYHTGHPVGEFAETFLAFVLLFVGNFAPIAGAIWAGVQVGRRTKKTWLGWSAAILTLAILFAGSFAFDKIPGVGWRIQQLRSSDDTGE